MSFFKSNTTTNTTNATTNEANQETGNNNGGLLKGLAIGVGTLAGIGAAYFGHKVYKSHHVVADENNLEDAKVDDDETVDESVEVTENNETVESFNEVETEEPANETPVEAEEAKTEETKNEKPSAASLVDQLETEASVFEKEMVLPIEVKTTIEQMDFLMGRIAQCHRTIGDNARISVAVCKLQNGVKDFWLGINTKLAMQTNDLESLDVIEDLYGADIDMVDHAYFDMLYINKSTLVLGTKDATVQLFNRLVRVADKMSKKSSTKSTGETQTVENAFDAFKEGHKESNKVDGETKTEETLTYTMSDKIQEAVQQSDETAATTEPESKTHVLMSPEASEMARKLQEAGELIRAKKWSDASEFYKTQLTPYLADDKLTDELREEIMSIKTMATNMLMSQKQLEAKQKAASAKASKKGGKRRRRH